MKRECQMRRCHRFIVSLICYVKEFGLYPIDNVLAVNLLEKVMPRFREWPREWLLKEVQDQGSWDIEWMAHTKAT